MARARDAAPTRRVSGEEGFTLLELVIAMLLMSIAVAALVGVLGTAFKSTAIDVHRTDATAIAAQGLAELQAAPVTGSLPAVSRNGETYSVNGTVGAATASDGDPNAYTSLSVSVSWSDQGGVHTLTQTSARFPGPTTTAVPCAAPALAGAPLYNAPTSGDPSLDVSWQEPSGGTPVTQWRVQVSPDGTTWTTAISNELPLPPGAPHQVEIGGLAGADAYAVRVVAISGCAAPQAFPATAGATPATPAATSSSCDPGSMTLGPSVVDRLPGGPAPGLLAFDITVVVTTGTSCHGGFWVGAQATDGVVVTATLTPGSSGTYSYVGTLPGLAQGWDLGTHQVELFTGVSSPGPLPAGAIATAVLCVEEQGSATC